MANSADDPRSERPETGPRAVKGGAVSVRQGGAQSIDAEDVAIRQGGALRVKAERVDIVQGGIALASADRIRMTTGTVGAAFADRVRLEQTATTLAAARERLKLDQSAAGVVVGGSVSARDTVIGLALTPRLEATGVRVLMGPRAAMAFGAGLGLVLALARLLRRR